MDNTGETSFIKQSLAETLTGNNPSSRGSTTKVGSSKSRGFPSVRELASRKLKADEDTGGILKSLGLTPSSRTGPGNSKEAVTDWEEIGNSQGTESNLKQESSNINKSKSRLPTGPEEFSKTLNSNSESTPTSVNKKNSTNQLSRHRSLKINETETISSLRQKLIEAESARDILSVKCKQLERELNELKSSKAMNEGKTLGVKEYEQLEKQFDAQEKLLSGYQRENERSLIELESGKVKMLKMSNLLSKVYGPDWEENILTNDGLSPIGTFQHNPNLSQNLNVPSTTTILNTSEEKLSAQLAQVQLLVQGMERKLLGRAAELEELHKTTQLDQEAFQKSIQNLNLSR